MKIVVLGSHGMLGKDLIVALKDQEVFGYDRHQCDVTNPHQVSETLRALTPDIVINAAAYTKVDDAEDHEAMCRSVNVDGTQHIVDACKKIGAALVQISTGYVFDGKKEGYKEGDKKNPINAYGRSKADAEDIALSYPQTYLVRSSWLYGHHGKNFADTILEMAKSNDEIKIVSDQVGSPTYTKDLAQSIAELIQQPFYGIYHITNDGHCSWYQYAQAIVKIKGIGCEVIPVSTDELPRPAKRPASSILLNTKISPLRHWKLALQEYLQ